jgi:molybdopterin-guanine dinucleotide biosynthesis protein A
MTITGIIIAGGKSTRMGKDKAFIKYNGKMLIEYAVSVITPIVNSIIISSNNSQNIKNFNIVSDIYKNTGPIAGIYSCIKASQTFANIVVPCDTPFVSTGLLKMLITEFQKNKNIDAVVPRLPDGKIEPLIAVYTKNILSETKKAIENKDYKLVNLLSNINTKYFDITDTEQFKNINTPNDLL